jgi:hypothetical protein
MKKIYKDILLIIAVIVSAIIMISAVFFLPRHGEVVYNCTWAEISPDIPQKVKEECRKLRMEKIK